jgi:tRNA A-37 threonylcarbamoyl transferase component Bud32
MSNLEFVKRNVTLHEYEMHKLIYELDIVNVPRPISYDLGTSTLVMERIDNLDISNMYGDDINLVPKDIVNCVRMIIRTLLLNDIEYPDITGYNFIQKNGTVWIIDFEHAKLITKSKVHPFIVRFINGYNSWNPDFA